MHENYPNIRPTNFMQQIGITREENLQCAYNQELQIVHWYAAERWGQWATILRKKGRSKLSLGVLLLLYFLTLISLFHKP